MINLYDFLLSVSVGVGIVYDIVIDSLFKGVLNYVDDVSFGEVLVSVSVVFVMLNFVVSVLFVIIVKLIVLGYYVEFLVFFEVG